MINVHDYKNPLIIAGHGIRLSGAVNIFHALLDKLNVPVVTTFNGFDIMPSDHPNFAGRIGTMGTPEGNKALREADLIICLGTRNNVRQTGYNRKSFSKNTKTIILVDIDRKELFKTCLESRVRRFCCEDVKVFIQRWVESFD